MVRPLDLGPFRAVQFPVVIIDTSSAVEVYEAVDGAVWRVLRDLGIEFSFICLGVFRDQLVLDEWHECFFHFWAKLIRVSLHEYF